MFIYMIIFTYLTFLSLYSKITYAGLTCMLFMFAIQSGRMLFMFAIQGGQLASKKWRHLCLSLIRSTAPIPMAAD